MGEPMAINLALGIAILTIFATCCRGADDLGCYTETRPRIFAGSAGGYDPDALTSTICRSKCALMLYRYAALYNGRFCFCSDVATLPSPVSAALCNVACTGDGTETCGSDNHVNLWRTPIPISSVTMDASISGAAATVVEILVAMDFTLAVTTGAVTYETWVDFGEGAGPTDAQTLETRYSKQFTVPGKYVIAGYTGDSSGLIQTMSYRVEVLVQCQVQKILLECPEVVPSHEEFFCRATILKGSGLTITVDYQDSSTETFPIADPYWHSAGPGIPYNSTNNSVNDTDGANTYTMHGAVFRESGTLLSFEYFAVATGSIVVTLLRPTCGTYCAEENTCGGCSSTPSSCGASEVYCPSDLSCTDSATTTANCHSPVNVYASTPDDYAVVGTFTVVIPTVGWGVYEVDLSVDLVSVLAGDVLAYTNSGTGRLGTRSLWTGEISDREGGGTYTTLSGQTLTWNRHLLRGIAARPSKVMVFHTYTVANTYTPLFTVDNVYITGSDNNNTVVIVQDKINVTEIISDTYGATWNVMSYTLEPHTGTDITYSWYVDGSFVENTTTPDFNMGYSARGEKNVTVRALNLVDEKWGWFITTVQDSIYNMQVTSFPSIVGFDGTFNLTMSNGSDFSCSWTWGDSATNGASNVTITPIIGSNFYHLFTSANDFSTVVTCSNDVSTDTVTLSHTVQEPITGITLTTTGALRNQAFGLEFTIATGSDATFLLDFDGSDFPVQIDPVDPLLWRTVSSAHVQTTTGLYVINITGSNLVSSETLIANFTVDMPITNLQCSASTDSVIRSAVVEFTLTMSEGTSVNAFIDFDNGANDTYSLAPLENWPSGYVRRWTQLYDQPAEYNITIKIQNNYNSFVCSHMVYVINKVANLTLVSNGPVAFQNNRGTLFFGFTTTAVAPSKAKVSFSDLGDGSVIDPAVWVDQDFGLWPGTQYGPHYFNAIGTYTIVANVSNAISWEEYDITVDVVLPISDVQISVTPSHAPINSLVTLEISMERGNGVTLIADWGDGTPIDSPRRVGTTPWEQDTMTHVYTAVGTYDISLTASNAVGDTTLTYRIVVQHPVTEDFSFTSSAPVYISDGTTVDFTLTYPATAILPDDSSYFVLFGDGSRTDPVTLPFAGITRNLNFSHPYPGTGDHVATMVISNLASSMEFHVSAGIYTPLSGLTVEAKYREALPLDGPYKLGVDGNKFPLDLPVAFLVDTNVGMPVVYTVEATEQGSGAVHMCNVSVSPATIQFSAPGTYDVVVTASTPLDSLQQIFTIVVAMDVTEMMIPNIRDRIEPNQPNTFDIRFGSVSSEACVVIDYGDGKVEAFGSIAACTGHVSDASVIAGPLVNPLPASHMYSAEGTYAVTLKSFSPFGNDESTYEVVVSAKDCSRPELTIIYGSSDFQAPIEFYRSDRIIVTTETQLPCTLFVKNTKSWQVFRIDENTGQPYQTIDLSTLTSKNKSDIAMPARYLEYGLYKLTHTVIIDDDPAFRDSADTYIRVVATPLIAAIVESGMTSITIPYGEMWTLHPGQWSTDPDVDPAENQALRFTYYCRQNHEHFKSNYDGSLSTADRSGPLDHTVLETAFTASDFTGLPDAGGCFRQAPGAVSYTNGDLVHDGTLAFSTYNMYPNETYEFLVQVSKGSRVTTARLDVEVSQNAPPYLVIKCTEDCPIVQEGLEINPTHTIRLEGQCKAKCSSTMYYTWRIYRKGLNDAWLLITDLEQYATGQNSAKITIDRSLFDRGFELYDDLTRYKVELTATGAGSSGEGISSTVLVLNKAPTMGNCTKTILEGSSRRIVCMGFDDPDGIATYKFYANFGDSLERQLGFNREGILDTKLPIGPSYNNYVMQLYVRVYDGKGATVTYHIGSDQVMPLSEAELDETIERLLTTGVNEFTKIAAEGNLYDVNTFMSVASQLNVDSKTMIESEYSGVGVASAESSYGFGPDYQNYLRDVYNASISDADRAALIIQYETTRSRNVEVRDFMITTVTNITAETSQSLHLVASTMAEITKAPEEISRESQVITTMFLHNAANTLETISADVPFDELKETVTALLAVIGNVFESSTIALAHPVTEDVERSKLTDMYDYDTNYESMRAEFGDLNLEEAKVAFALETNFEVHTNTASEMIPNLDALFQRIAAVLFNKMIPGEDPVKMTTPKMTMTMQKDTANMLTGRTVTEGNTQITIPDYCSWALDNPCVAPTQVIGIQTMSTATNMYSYIRAPDTTLDIPDNAGTVSMTIFDENNQPISITESTQPFLFVVPKDISLADLAEPTDVIPKIGDKEDLFYHVFNDTSEGTANHIEIVPSDPTKQFLVVVRYGDFPSLNDSVFVDVWGTVPRRLATVKPASAFGDNLEEYLHQYTIMINNIDADEFRSRNGSAKIYVGLRELGAGETDPSELPLLPEPMTGRFTTDYSIRTWISSCVYHVAGPLNNRWETAGLEVQPATTLLTTSCSSHHLTTFSTGWAVAPNAIDFDYVFANLDFYKNPTLYTAEIVVCVIYILFAIWCRRKDLKDKMRLGVTPLSDNDPNEKYYYEIVVQTGIRKSAATDSKVHFILSGEWDETDVRVFDDPQRKIFRRGATDSFLMTTARPLGPMSYARVWHDNAGKGKYQSWYLNYIIVHDLQTKERSFFIANQWFACDESDGQVDRLLPLSGPEQMKDISHLFADSATRKLSDDHLWFSVIARPPESRFTRLQRLSCVLLLLFTSMLANAMYYEKLADGTGQNALQFGPFALTPEQIYVGIICNLVVFPINFLVVTLFRKSRPKRKRSSRLIDAIRKNEANAQRSRQSNSETDMTIFTASTNDLKPFAGETSSPSDAPQRMETPIQETSDMTKPLDPAVPKMNEEGVMTAPAPSSSDTVLPEEKPKKTKKPFSLPWWCTIFGWILLWLGVLTSTAFVTFYGIQFGDEKTRKWITSLVISFLTSIFLTQPIKVFLVALLFSLVFKKSELIDEVAEEDEENIELGNNEQWLHAMPGQDGYKQRERKLAYSPPDPVLLAKARELRMKEMKMYDIMREIAFYAVFLWMLLVISYGFRDPNAFYMKNGIQSALTDLGLGEYGDAEKSFYKMRTMDDFWSWAEHTMVTSLRAGDWYNGDEPVGQRGFIYDRVSRLMGYPVLRQLRVPKNQCRTVAKMRALIPDCYSGYSIWDEDTSNFGVGWTPFEGNSTQNNSKPEYVYRDATELEGWPFLGGHALYGGGGYVVELKGNSKTLYAKLAELKADEWVDKETRAVFLEFSVYNAYVNLFGVTTFIAEFLPTGGVQVYYRVEPMDLLGHITNANLFLMICEIVYLCFIVFFMVKEMRKLIKQKKHYFKEPWNYIEVSIIMLSVSGLVIYFYRLLKSKELAKRFKETNGNGYIKMQYVAYWNELLLYMLGWLVFLSSVKFIRLLRFNKRMSLLAQTLRHGAKPLMMFGIMFGLVFFAYAQFFYFVYFMELTNFSHIIYAAETCMQMLIGKFNFNAMQGASPVLGPLFFFCYVVTVYYILINMFLTILNESFASVRHNIELQSNEYEMVDFIIQRFSQWTGIGGVKDKKKGDPDYEEGADGQDGKKKPLEQQIDNFPERVDRLMDTISKVFLDQNTFESMFVNSNSPENKDAMKMMMGKDHLRDMPGSKDHLRGLSGTGKDHLYDMPGASGYGNYASAYNDRLGMGSSKKGDY